MASVNVSNPAVNISATANPICKGDTTTLSAGYMTGSTYTWSNGLGTANSVEVWPSITTTYTVTVNSFGCTASSDITVTVNQKPAIPSITGATSVCAGYSTTLNAGAGYSSYYWSTGTSTETMVPTSGGTFTVTVSKPSGCTASPASALVNVESVNPVITGPTTICNGNNTTLDAGAGYSSYSWSNSANTRTISVSPSITSYTVTVTTSLGCSGTASVTVNISKACPFSCQYNNLYRRHSNT